MPLWRCRKVYDREAMLVPLMLNHPERRQFDHQVFWAHVAHGRASRATPKAGMSI